MAKNQLETEKVDIAALVAALNASNSPVKAPSNFKFIPDMDDDALRKLTREKLSKALQAIDPETQPGMTLKLCSEMKDRLDGKPGQAVTVTSDVTINVLAKEIRQQSLADVQDLVKRLTPPVIIDN